MPATQQIRSREGTQPPLIYFKFLLFTTYLVCVRACMSVHADDRVHVCGEQRLMLDVFCESLLSLLFEDGVTYQPGTHS